MLHTGSLYGFASPEFCLFSCIAFGSCRFTFPVDFLFARIRAVVPLPAYQQVWTLGIFARYIFDFFCRFAPLFSLGLNNDIFCSRCTGTYRASVITHARYFFLST